MGTLTKEYIVIDWGFTRLKLWSLNQNRKIIKEKYIYIKDLNPNPEFYLLNSFKKISNEISNFIEDSRNLNTEINILSSCQMHCLAGILESDEPFLSSETIIDPNESVTFIDVEIPNSIGSSFGHSVGSSVGPSLHLSDLNVSENSDGNTTRDSESYYSMPSNNSSLDSYWNQNNTNTQSSVNTTKESISGGKKRNSRKKSRKSKRKTKKSCGCSLF